jgi:hypothetical protein|mmetsp:Transcript_39025/g.61826  ORF Transcript_39025/g.61826 Transcript_39025/m.61826 type:complete len:298 (+) Transcript_39025:70-963(+)|eukprot:CAMPEP_0169124866 /NCGR_PEP_ID=MMETSP1015-20121227/34564_1 /TAXON_ID=342587 /ORGANISM="Karlodinium micrum, Strain CCMP2283" /LENGTH=297 /DNA_ID=CAMNT_0009188333 /DNA_START=70 /DNA_END=963 /DNA_ORIENTATION=+
MKRCVGRVSVLLSSVLLASSWLAAEAGSLRAAPKVAATPAKPKAESEASPPPAAVDAAMDLIKSLKVASAPSANSSSQKAATTSQGHAKLDVGFSEFEKTAVEEVGQKLLRTATGTAWSNDMRAQFEKNVTDAMKETMKSIMKPLKTSIAKTWMALPQDSQKDEYVATLKKSFGPVFESSMHTITSHLDMSLKRIETYSSQKKEFTAEALLKKSETTIADSLLNDHCYEVDAKHLKSSSNSSDAKAEKKQFCIQSVIGALAHRLNDTQSLISMSMRFEAGAMSLAQKQKKQNGKMTY